MNGRRVIFVDPELWTQPREQEPTMTDNPEATNAADYRRASVLTLHHRQGNIAGLVAIVDEVNATGRAAHLIMATLALHEDFITQLRTRDGINIMADWVNGMAALAPDATEPSEVAMCRAAQIVEHYGMKNIDGIQREMAAAAADNRGTEAFLGVMDLYEVALPELSSGVGIKWLQDHASAFATEEVQP